MPSVSVQSMIDAYRPARERCGTVRAELAKLDAEGVVSQEESLRSQLMAVMQPNWLYRWDENQALVKRRKGRFGWELAILPIKVEPSADFVPPEVEPGVGLGRIGQMAAAAAISLGVGFFAPRGCDINVPWPTPTPDSTTYTAANVAGYEFAKSQLLPAYATTFVETSNILATSGDPMAVIQEGHVARGRARMIAGPDAAFVKFLDTVSPGDAEPTPAQRSAIATAFSEFAAGLQRAAK